MAALQHRAALEAQAAAEERERAAAKASERHAEEQLRKDLDVRDAFALIIPPRPCLAISAHCVTRAQSFVAANGIQGPEHEKCLGVCVVICPKVF